VDIKPDKIVYSNRRTFSLEIDEWGKLTVRVPQKATGAEIARIVAEKHNWIVKKQHQMKAKSPQSYNFDGSDEFFFMGKKYPLLFAETKTKVAFDGEQFIIAEAERENLRELMVGWYKAKAIKIASYLTDKYTDKLGIKHRNVKITSAKTRWGSCSSRKNININWRLVLAPLQVLEYVIAHEVAHLKYMNHSADFWQTVAFLQPNYKTYKKWLKENNNLLSF
jgi:predicted metal-dependent hydrolase